MLHFEARHQQLCHDRQQRFWREAEAQRLAFQARSAAATQMTHDLLRVTNPEVDLFLSGSRSRLQPA